MEKYSVELTGEQIHILCQALESFTRLGIGQLETVLQDLGFHSFDQFQEVMTTINGDLEYLAAVQTIKKKIFDQPMNGSYSIHNERVGDNFKCSYDMWQVLRNRVAWDKNPSGGITSDYNEPNKLSTHELIKIKKKTVHP